MSVTEVERRLTRLAPNDQDSAISAIRKSIDHHGHPESSSVHGLCADLGVDAVLAVRVDRWERIVKMNDPVTTAYVEIEATLLDSRGDVLWRARGYDRENVHHDRPELSATVSEALPVRQKAVTGNTSFSDDESGRSLLYPKVDAADPAQSPKSLSRIYSAPGAADVRGRMPEDFARAFARIVGRCRESFPDPKASTATAP